ncbi:MAG: SUF system Fe-S cluster assembly protein [Chromatiaceae bacterium]|jgi:FeS assembly SUF system protein|nr:SUF system Fe-S cluster assembly protein [Chromatiaceae bacterium]
MNRLARLIGFGKKRQGDTEDDPVHAEQSDQEVFVERMDSQELYEPIVDALRTVHDPEIPVNIYDLGLIYRIDIAETGDVDIAMTLTAPACPVAGAMPAMVEEAVRQVEGVGEVNVELVWDPPWTQEKMTDEALLQLGMI